jgi:type III restriction enzyme
MALHPDFPDSPHAILDPQVRWFPADEALRETGMDKLMPPLVATLRKKVKEFRDSGYVGATETSRSLLTWWFKAPHLLPQADGTMASFQYYFAQREALETIIYLYDVVGTEAFMVFVESIQAEGVELERKAMGEGTKAKTPLVVEVDTSNEKKDIEALDIEIPVLTPRVYREYKNLADLDRGLMVFQSVIYQQFSEEEQREIVFKDITTGEVTHTTILDTAGVADYRSVIGYYAQTVMKELRLVSGYDVLYGKIKAFIQSALFRQPVDLESPNTLRNLSELAATKTVIETFKKAVNGLTVRNKGDAEIRDTIKLRQTRPFVVKDQGYLIPKKSVFNRVIGDSSFELQFASFLEDCSDLVSYAKNYLAVHFKLDYVNADGDISNYYPDFFVKLSDRKIVIVETKGQVDVDVPFKIQRLRQWCEDINAIQKDVNYDFVYVDEESFQRYQPKTFRQLLEGFREFKKAES